MTREEREIREKLSQLLTYRVPNSDSDLVTRKSVERVLNLVFRGSRDLDPKIDDDVISRAELLKAMDTWDKFGCDADTKLVPYNDNYVPYIHYDDVIKCIKGMPSVVLKEPKTQCVEKSNFDIMQYNTDLQSAYDCGKASQESKIESEE